MKAGCHPVAIAQVVESTDSLSQRPLVQFQVAADLSQFSQNIPNPFDHADVHGHSSETH